MIKYWLDSDYRDHRLNYRPASVRAAPLNNLYLRQLLSNFCIWDKGGEQKATEDLADWLLKHSERFYIDEPSYQQAYDTAKEIMTCLTRE